MIRLVQTGDRDAFAELYGRYRNGVYDYCMHLLRDRERAGEALQETFVRAFAGAQGLRDGGVLRPWLFSIARNYVFNALRDGKPCDELDESSAVEPGTPYDAVVQSERSENLRHLVDRLDPSLRELIVLREYEELSYAEIAEVTGISHSNVRLRLFKARKALAELFGKNYRKEDIL